MHVRRRHHGHVDGLDLEIRGPQRGALPRLERRPRRQRRELERDGASRERPEAPAAAGARPLHDDAEALLQRGQQHLVEVLVGRREGDVGAARELELDRCPGAAARVAAREQQEGEDGLEDEQRAGGGARGFDGDPAARQVRGLAARPELERVRTHRQARHLRVGGGGEPLDRGDVLVLEAFLGREALISITYLSPLPPSPSSFYLSCFFSPRSGGRKDSVLLLTSSPRALPVASHVRDADRLREDRSQGYGDAYELSASFAGPAV